MRFWWVNQGQTYREEREGNYLWSPKRNRNGNRNPSYDLMPLVATGDRILHNKKGRLRSQSVVVRGGRSAQQPAELAARDLWDDDGWRVDVRHRPVARHVPTAEAHALGPTEPVFDVNAVPKTAYLFEISADYGMSLIRALTSAAPASSVTKRSRAEEPSSEDVIASGAVETVELEAGSDLVFVQQGSGDDVQVARSEWSLVDLLVATTGIEPVRRRYTLADGRHLYSDLWIARERMLIEAKASASRRAVREAIGQLADYAQKEREPVSKMLLVPEPPAEDLLAVLHGQRIVAVWPAEGDWQRSDGEPLRWSV